MLDRKVIFTADGSKTLYVAEMDEHYHSFRGAYTESRHIFIDMGFRKADKKEARILEVGFGTGLNAILTLIEACRSGIKVQYDTFELYPLSLEIIEMLDYPDNFFPDFQEEYYRLHRAEWEKDIPIMENFILHKTAADFTASPVGIDYDLVYFDAFAPEKQPEMWDQSIFDKLYNCLNKGGIVTTYCAKGVVRRRLQAAGFTTERLPGPPHGKREIIRAIK